MKIAHGLAFPDVDEFMVKELSAEGTYQRANLDAALQYVTNVDCAIDGGAHVGTWSLLMARTFAKVIAVEPSADTFECLTTNLEHAGLSNVVPLNVALGAEAAFARMELDPENAKRANTGGRRVKPGGSIHIETIDSWHLPSLGFLKLDVEGSEYVALQGAAETLKRCKPIVLFESKFLWTRYYGIPKEAVTVLLLSLGYKELARVSRDAIWGPR